MNRCKNFGIARVNKESIPPAKQKAQPIGERLGEAGFETAHNGRGAVLSCIPCQVSDNFVITILS